MLLIIIFHSVPFVKHSCPNISIGKTAIAIDITNLFIIYLILWCNIYKTILSSS